MSIIHRPNDTFHAIIQTVDFNGKVIHQQELPQVTLARLITLLNAYTMGRELHDAWIRFDIAFPDRRELTQGS